MKDSKAAMIPRSAPTWQGESPLNWKEQLQQAITEPQELVEALKLDKALLPAVRLASKQFPLRVPYAFIDRMEKGNIKDPLLQQVLPVQEELIAHSGYSTDPVGEQVNELPGLIQKYHGRVLLVINGHCAVNCRYCFRRHFPYEENRLSRDQWVKVIDQIKKDTSTKEVIYSGGDPLASSDSQLQWLTDKITAIPHIQRLRVHTRFPVVIPNRMTPECLNWIANHRLHSVVVLHINHPNEIDDSLRQAIIPLQQAGVTLLNQAVLLKGINDDLETQRILSEKLFDISVLPYYLHLLDPVSGAAHFNVSIHKAEQLYQQLQAHLPGYLVPKLVKEVAGQPSKTPIEQLNALRP
jgi:EF-P beta-lysylation protein EpmB